MLVSFVLGFLSVAPIWAKERTGGLDRVKLYQTLDKPLPFCPENHCEESLDVAGNLSQAGDI